MDFLIPEEQREEPIDTQNNEVSKETERGSVTFDSLLQLLISVRST